MLYIPLWPKYIESPEPLICELPDELENPKLHNRNFRAKNLLPAGILNTALNGELPEETDWGSINIVRKSLIVYYIILK